MAEMTKEQEAAYKEQDRLLKREKWHLLLVVVVMSAMVWSMVEYGWVQTVKEVVASSVVTVQAWVGFAKDLILR